MRKKLDIEKYLSNQDFIQWVKKPNRELDLYWQKWIKNHPKDKKTISLAKEIVTSVKFKEEDPSAQEYDAALNKILADERFNKQATPVVNWRSLYRVAASLLLIVAFSMILYQLTQLQEQAVVSETNEVKVIQKENPKGQKSNFKLPDGTNVWLNAKSSISFPQKFSDSIRLVKLQGEAFFEVVENPQIPFVVQAGTVFTRALGTSFNVNNYDSTSLSVSLVTGKVLVTREKNEMVLNPGEKIIYQQAGDAMIKKEFNYKQEISWIDGVIYFENANFNEIENVLERWYGVDITVEGLDNKNWSYNGSFDNQSLEVVLKRLSFSKNFDFNIEDKSVKIKFK